MIFLSTDDADEELDDHGDAGHNHNQYETNFQPGYRRKMMHADVAVADVLRKVQW